MRGSDAKLTEPRSEIDCCPSQGESATPWLANLVRGIAVSMDHLGLEGAVFEDALPRVRKQCQTTKPMSALRRRPQQHPESWPSPRNPFLFEALVVMTKDRQTQEQKASPEKKLAKQRPSGRQGKCPSCWRICPEAGERAQHTGDQNGAQRRIQGGAGLPPEGPLSLDPGLAGFRDRLGEDSTTEGSLLVE